VVRERVETARERQKQRFAGTNIYCNAMIPDNLLREYCRLEGATATLMQTTHERYSLSARAYCRLQRLALSAADLHGHDKIERDDLATALQFRSFESKYLQ
ncbi:MAG: ATP-binding protein, partial [Oscillospiraceae bacterium]|nr:ATP-binding protein [Oscillospiraceae bacterium]